MPVYLVHLEEPYEHARHYVGFVDRVDGLESRLDYHRSGKGSKFLRAVELAGIEWNVVRFWPEGDRNFERRLKGRSATRYCPVCTPVSSGTQWFDKLESEEPGAGRCELLGVTFRAGGKVTLLP